VVLSIDYIASCIQSITQSFDHGLAKAGIIMKTSQQTTVILKWDHSGIMAKEGSDKGTARGRGNGMGRSADILKGAPGTYKAGTLSP